MVLARAHPAGGPASRRQEAEARLREMGRAAAAPGGWTPEAAAPFESELGRRLGQALASLGPVFTAYGAYLSTRLDLLGAADGLALRGLREEVEPTPAAAVRALIEEAAGRPLATVLDFLEEVPARCDLVGQVHRARLPGGTPARVRIVHPDLAARLAPDLDLLPLVGYALGESFPAERAAADFRRALAARADLAAQAQAFAAVQGEAARRGWLRLPRVELAGDRVLCVEDLGGEELAPAARRLSPEEADDLARRACLGWLRCALAGRALPVELAPADLRLLPDGSLGLRGCVLESLPPETQADLRDYLEAVAADDPGEALACLLRGLEPAGPEGGAPEELRQLFRQAVPFRAGAWEEAAGGSGVAAALLLQWRLAGERGLRPLPPWLAFYRGLCHLAAAVAPLAPGADPLRAAVEDSRLVDAFERLAGLADPERLRRAVEGYAAALADLPEALDRALRLSAEGRPRLRLTLQPATRSGRERRRDARAAAVALLVALASVVLLTHRVAAVGPWAEGIGAALYLAIGALLLRVLARQG